MKIACIGNMNNMVFPTCCYLVDAGYKPTLFLLDEYEHFIPLPEQVPKELEIINLGWNESTYESISKKKIASIFYEYDFFIGTDYSAAYLTKANIMLDIYMPAGSDFFDWPFKKFNSALPEKWEISKVKCAKNQYFGISNAEYISLDKTNEEWESLLRKMRTKTGRIPVLPFVYFNAEKKSEESANTDTFIIFQHCRQAWKYPKNNPHNKGNDILFKGFKLFSKKQQNVQLRLLEYGEHVLESKKLIKELHLEEYVEWLPKMHKEKISKELTKANICVGNLNNSYLSYGAVYEALAHKVAFMGYRKDDLYTGEYEELYPMINAHTAQGVATELEYYFQKQEKLEAMRLKGNDWLLKYAINPSVNKIIEIINNHKGRKKLPTNWSLLALAPYFWFIKFYNFFRIKLGRWVKI